MACPPLQTGTVYYVDPQRDILYEVPVGGAPRVLSNRLVQPRVVLWESAGQLLLLAHELKPESPHPPPAVRTHGLLLRMDLQSKAIAVLADDLYHPHALARSNEGTIYVSADAFRLPKSNGHRGMSGRGCRRG